MLFSHLLNSWQMKNLGQLIVTVAGVRMTLEESWSLDLK
jgi:hypothetical protein